ncbi:MAG: hypothetical protein ACTSRI_14905 [Promethearchaeota archaeon]
MKETRFRDILACEKCWDILKLVIKRTFENYKDIKSINLNAFKIIAREFPLVKDKYKHQIRKIDILGINNGNDLFIIELKKSYSKEKGRIDEIINQINDYQIILKKNINEQKNQKRDFSIYHFYQQEIFNIMNIVFNKIERIFKIILFIKDSIPTNISDSSTIPIGCFKEKELDALAKFYVNFQINRINDLTPGFDEILHKKCYSKFINAPIYRPIPLTNFDNIEDPIFRLESLYTNEKRTIKINKSKLIKSWKLPMLYPKESTLISSEKFFNKQLSGEFFIQIFRSGRSNPIFYFEYINEKFFPFHQIKSRLFQRGDLVNRTIAEDASGIISNKTKKTIFEEVIFFDVGTYKTETINKSELKYLHFYLTGKKYKIEFEMTCLKKIKDSFKKKSKIPTPKSKFASLLSFMKPTEPQINNKKSIPIENMNVYSNTWKIENLKILKI